MITVGESIGKGRGIFAREKILKGQKIEEAPVVVLPAAEIELLEKTVLQDYYFLWGEDKDQAAMVLGLCSLCNHSYNPNAIYERKLESLTMEFVALRDIEAGEEVTVNYNGDPENQDPVWFDVLP